MSNVLHFIAVDEDGQEYSDSGKVLDIVLGECGNTYLVIQSKTTGEEVHVSPEMVTSLY